MHNNKTLDMEIRNENGVLLGNYINDCAGFRICNLELPSAWEYIYQNRDILLKVDQFGPVYAQERPPGGIQLFRRESLQQYSNWTVWFDVAGINGDEPFTCFYKPRTNGARASKLPATIDISLRPESVVYTLVVEDFKVETEFFVPKNGREIVMVCKFSNEGKFPREVKIYPTMIPYINAAQMAPWDRYEWYLKTGTGKQEKPLFWTQLMNSESDASKRQTAVLLTEEKALEGVEISLEKFIGHGSLEAPEIVVNGNMRMPSPTAPYGEYNDDNTLYGYPPVYSAKYKHNLQPGTSESFVQVLCVPDQQGSKWLAPFSSVEKSLRYFNVDERKMEKEKLKSYFENQTSRNHISTKDKMFDYYANKWIPLQMEWVASLDRGWPTGMRGTRDSAQDYAGLLFSGDFVSCRKVLLDVLSCQRRDGWFPRQYSALGREGSHDLREYVDGGTFVLEYAWQYLAHSGDFPILKTGIPWLDEAEETTVLAHLMQAMNYYREPENLGEHGLCKIRGGDWLDSVNRAGHKGRGESVMVSIQVTMCVKYLADILENISHDTKEIAELKAFGESLALSVQTSAYNSRGFFNGTYTDNGEWIFSENDPDGYERLYGPVNWYAIVAGLVKSESGKKLLDLAEKLKGPCGYRLYHPPMGKTEILNVGRAGSGDAPYYFGENGNVYNHGSQGFLVRAAAAAGDGKRLMDVLRWLLPYDQIRHPVDVAASAPYAIANCWQELPVFTGRTMMTFLTGSVAMAYRGVYEWMFGVQPQLDSLVLAPVLDTSIPNAELEFMFREHIVHLTIFNNNGCVTNESKLIFNGREIRPNAQDMFTMRPQFSISLSDFAAVNKSELWL